MTVTISKSGSSDVTHDATNDMLTFTAANWASSQTVRVSAAEDDADHLDDTATISHTVTSTDGDYNNRSVGSVTVTVTDDEEVPVTVSFDRATHQGDEGESFVITVRLDADPERRVVIPIVKTERGGLTSADYSDVPRNVVFESGDTEEIFTVTTVDDTIDDDDESLLLEFGALPDAVEPGTRDQVTISLDDDDDPVVTVSYKEAPEGTYSVQESDDSSTTGVIENQVEITVKLSANPERRVTVEIRASGQGGATEQDNTGADYSGVPASVTFNDGETEKSFTIIAVHDTVDDDGESIALSFGNLPPGVLRGDGTTVTIEDDDVPDVEVSFGAAAYEVTEGASVRVIVELNKDPERQVVIPITASNQDASDQDYSGVPTGVTFESGDTEQEISFSATQDSGDDDGESVVIRFGSSLPSQVTVTTGMTRSTTVTIVDDDNPNVTVNFEQTSYDLVRRRGRLPWTYMSRSAATLSAPSRSRSPRPARMAPPATTTRSTRPP